MPTRTFANHWSYDDERELLSDTRPAGAEHKLSRSANLQSLLVVLLDNLGQSVKRDDIKAKVWPSKPRPPGGTAPPATTNPPDLDHPLDHLVFRLRAKLGEEHFFIHTSPGLIGILDASGCLDGKFVSDVTPNDPQPFPSVFDTRPHLRKPDGTVFLLEIQLPKEFYFAPDTNTAANLHEIVKVVGGSIPDRVRYRRTIGYGSALTPRTLYGTRALAVAYSGSTIEATWTGDRDTPAAPNIPDSVPEHLPTSVLVPDTMIDEGAVAQKSILLHELIAVQDTNIEILGYAPLLEEDTAALLAIHHPLGRDAFERWAGISLDECVLFPSGDMVVISPQQKPNWRTLLTKKTPPVEIGYSGLQLRLTWKTARVPLDEMAEFRFEELPGPPGADLLRGA